MRIPIILFFAMAILGFFALLKKAFQKKNYIIPKEGEIVTLRGGLKGTVIGFKGEKVVVEVHSELSDIMH